MVFIDRYNKVSNTWYYEDIICVNPCGEQGLPAWGVCNLGALNVAAFVRDGEMDYDALAEHAKVAIRFLDDVVDANEYFIPENRKAQLGTRAHGPRHDGPGRRAHQDGAAVWAGRNRCR